MYPRQRQGVNKGGKLEDREDGEVLIGQGNEDEVIHEINVVWRLDIYLFLTKLTGWKSRSGRTGRKPMPQSTRQQSSKHRLREMSLTQTIEIREEKKFK